MISGIRKFLKLGLNNIFPYTTAKSVYDEQRSQYLNYTINDSILAINGKISITKLWENASPTSTFAAQTIPVANTDFDFFICIAKNSDNAEQMENSNIFLKNHTAILGYTNANPNDSFYCFDRKITVSETNIVFSDCYGSYILGKPSLSNNQVIPLVVYGVKGVQQ